MEEVVKSGRDFALNSDPDNHAIDVALNRLNEVLHSGREAADVLRKRLEPALNPMAKTMGSTPSAETPVLSPLALRIDAMTQLAAETHAEIRDLQDRVEL